MDPPATATVDGVSSLAQTVGANVRLLRRTRGLSLVDLGRHAGVAKGTLTQLEAGRGNPTIDTLEALSRALGVTVRDLVTVPSDGAPEVVRADEGMRVAGWNPEARLIYRAHAAGAITELYGLRLGAGAVQQSPAHPPGVIEQLYVLSGTIDAGPEDARVTLRPHDFVRFDADQPHRYAAPDGPASGLLLVVLPALSVDIGPGRPERRTNGTRGPARISPPQIPARGVRPPTRAPPAGRRRQEP